MTAAGTVLAQVLLPLEALQTGRTYSEVAHLGVPYAVAAVLMVACLQIALVGVWMLVSAVSQGALYDQRTVVFVDVIRIALALAAAIPASVAVHLLFFVGLGGPGVVLALAFVCVVAPAVEILLTLLRRVYLRAREDHAELDAVV